MSAPAAAAPAEARNLNFTRIIVVLLALGWFCFQLWIVRSPLPPLVERPIHLLFAMAMLYLGSARGGRAGTGIAVISLAALAAYSLMNFDRLGGRMEDVDPVYLVDIVFGGLLMILLLEGVRRTAGWSLLSVILAFLAYAVFGPWLPGMSGFSGFRLEELTDILTMSSNGIWGITTETSVQFVYYFVAFGAFYGATGGGQLLIDLGLRVSGKQAGAPAKAAMISSSLMGSISGSAVANVAATGVFTIPLMRQNGYSGERAAAVEAIASTGGQLMPPVMGVAAFLMAELLQIDYWKIAVAGLIPATAFYVSIFCLVDFEARRAAAKAKRTAAILPPEEIIATPILPRIHLLLPPIVLIAVLAAGSSATVAAVVGIGACILSASLRGETRRGWRAWIETVVETGRTAAQVAIPIGAIGIIIAIAIQSNLALKFSTVLMTGGAGTLSGFLALIQSMVLVVVGCLIMGMGLPTVAAYVIGAILFVPALQQLGMPNLAAHFFVMYYCVLSMVTPPVALASYTAAGLAGASPLKTSMVAFRMSLVCFLIPFAFAFDPYLLAQNPGWWTVAAVTSLLLASILWAAGLAGFLREVLPMWKRAAAAVIALGIVLSPTDSPYWLVFVVSGGLALGLEWFRGADRQMEIERAA